MPRVLSTPGLNLSSATHAKHVKRAVHAAGAIALVVTGYLCFEQFRPKESSVVTPSVPVRGLMDEPSAQAVAAWLGPGEVRMNIRVLGVAVRDGRSVALLKVNDAPTRAVMVGESLPGGAIVSAIEPTEVSIKRGEIITRIKTPRRPPDRGGLRVVPANSASPATVRHD